MSEQQKELLRQEEELAKQEDALVEQQVLLATLAKRQQDTSDQLSNVDREERAKKVEALTVQLEQRRVISLTNMKQQLEEMRQEKSRSAGKGLSGAEKAESGGEPEAEAEAAAA